ncbi:hypothetical protein HBA55_08055 [Pseudomaricurvus alkylphenolicus]|jgi:hypothetical protein|uniref:hypothetical protein n=1 Tax=Pseudomaricurvus alkylphenolicus TaxID=1306991 RepID=UPI00141F802A|nr:hypothetical protein [Pseudomaricurvus alkylphenolicus]NIB39535.1 hypothetical protein [Pseudomaricurvus alkylphenolicus]
MKKLGFLLALALFANGAMANKVGSSYSNVAVIVAETGASSSWATKEIMLAEQNAQKMEETLEAANEKLASKLEQRFNRMLEASSQQ